MSYPCSPNTLGKRHRMGGAKRVTNYPNRGSRLIKIAHPNPGKINFRRSCPEGSMNLYYPDGLTLVRDEPLIFANATQWRGGWIESEQHPRAFAAQAARKAARREK